MKTKTYKILSLILIIASLVSAFAIFAYADDAEDDDTAGKIGEIDVLYNRNYEEGWDFDNGFKDAITTVKSNKFSIDYEELYDYSYNYFMRLCAANGLDGFVEFNFNQSVATKDNYGTVFEFRIKVDDYATNLGQIFYYNNASNKQMNNILTIEGNTLCFNSQKDVDPTEICVLSDEWMNIAIAFDWTIPERNMTIYYGELDEATHTYANKYTFIGEYDDSDKDRGIKWARFGFPVDAKVDRIGAGYCIDDLKIYNGSAVPVSIDASNKGNMVNTQAIKTINILAGSKVKTNEQLLEEALCMKVGINYALVRNEKKAIITDGESVYGAPVVKDGEVRVPLQIILDYIGFPYYLHPDNASFDITTGTSATYLTVGRTDATVSGKRVELSVAPGYVTSPDGKEYLTIGFSDIMTLFPGWLAMYDDMGLVIIYEDVTPDNIYDNAPLVDRYDGLDVMLNLMKKFIFNIDTSGTKKENYENTGRVIYSDIRKNTTVGTGDDARSFVHPYLIADQNTFDTLSDKYKNGNDEVLKGYVQSIVDKADAFYSDVAIIDGDSFLGIKSDKSPKNPYYADSTDGYSPLGGRLDVIADYSSELIPLAFAYQMTGNVNYVKLAYAWASALAEWEHWGPAYFIDCAEAAANYAIAYDWLYNAYEELGFDTSLLANALYNKALKYGYESSMGNKIDEAAARKLGDLSAYVTRDDHWNVVGASGMILGAIAVMGDIEDTDVLFYLIGNNLANLCKNGLNEYAPDGAYIESAVNWCYATNHLFYLMMGLESAAGSNYGFANTWGLDKTCYYAIHIEDSDGYVWNYHDGGPDGVNGELVKLDTHMFNFVGKMFGDSTLISVRAEQLASGKKEVSVFDLLFYPYDGVEELPELPINYYMSGVEAFISRSDWSDGALYTGLMGGPNTCNYGQVDSGNFIYRNQGVNWIMDLGNEKYDAYHYFEAERYNYYRVNAEGQNVIYMTGDDETDYPYGQYLGGSGKIVRYEENEYGSLAILDNSDVYPGLVRMAQRGMLVTNNMQTVVLQDEVMFTLARSAEWVIHTAEEVTLSDDARTAYLKHIFIDENGVQSNVWLRVSIVTPAKEYVFTKLKASVTCLKKTYGAKDSVSKGGAEEYSREDITKLIIQRNSQISFDIAVAFEIVDGPDSEMPVGYEWKDMSKWEPGVGAGQGGEESNKRGVANKNDIKTYLSVVSGLFNKKLAYTRIDDVYAHLTKVGYTFTQFPPSSDSSLAGSYNDYRDLCDEYEAYRTNYVGKQLEIADRFADVFFGQYFTEE